MKPYIYAYLGRPMYCIINDCFNHPENYDTGLCSVHNREERKRIENEKKGKKKVKPIAKVSPKRMEENKVYSILREQFLLGKWCAYHGHGCIPTTVHHAKGRIGTLLLNVKYWVPLCMQAHEWVERNPKEAKEKGLSVSRLEK